MKIHVSGNSMLPLLKDGDNVAIRSFDRYKTGDIIVYEGNTIVVHRIVDICNDSKQGTLYIAKGDNNFLKDPPLPKSKIIGKVTAVYRDNRKYDVKLDRHQKALTLLSILKAKHMGDNSLYKKIFRLKYINQCQRRVVENFSKSR